MAQINVTTTSEERDRVLTAISKLKGEIVPVSKIATMADIKPSRARYAILDLIESGKIKRIPHKAFNQHYIRYSYKIL